MEKEYMEFRYNEETGLWEEKKEPYTTIEFEFETKEDYEAFMEILPRVQEEYKRKKLRKSAEGGFWRCKMNKQIEEMARVMLKGNDAWHKFCEEMGNCKNCKYEKHRDYCEFIFFAEALHRAGYRKGGKDEEVAVVSEDLPPKDQEKERSIDEKIAKACKETARKILQDVNQLCKEQVDRFSHLCKTKKEAREETCRYEGVLAVKNRLGKIAEKYGVEVE